MLTLYMIVSHKAISGDENCTRSLLGASLITKRDIFIDRELMMHLLMW